ncbi:MAG: VOC family protein [Thermoplasmata archaeon]|nr:VOC family protein [Thermoplasmata archaeon]
MNLNQVTVPSTNVRASVDFYRRLGLKEIVDSVPEYARFECPDGEATLSVQRVDRLSEGPGVVVYFECDRLDQVVDKLKADGVVFDSDPLDQRWLWREAHLRDPDGNVICLFHAGPNRRNPPWRIPQG